ncbi:hypothetical protein ACFL6G_07015 [candidate division KSB1 bacterium]
MLVIKCSKCKKKIFRYNKIGKGRILRCWQDRIIENYAVKDGNDIYCKCGSRVGIDDGVKIKMIQRSFTSSGTYTNK